MTVDEQMGFAFDQLDQALETRNTGERAVQHRRLVAGHGDRPAALQIDAGTGRLVLLLMLINTTVSQASMCDMLASYVNESRYELTRASKASDLDEGQSRARRAQSALETASMVAMDCDCMDASIQLDDAATRARRAKNAGDADEFFDQLRRSIRCYNNALDAISFCASQ